MLVHAVRVDKLRLLDGRRQVLDRHLLAGLDPEATARLVDLFDELNANGRTIVISTHDVELALAWADEVIVMRAGEVIAHRCWF